MRFAFSISAYLELFAVGCREGRDTSEKDGECIRISKLDVEDCTVKDCESQEEDEDAYIYQNS